MSINERSSSRELFAAAEAARLREEAEVQASRRPVLAKEEGRIWGVGVYYHGDFSEPREWYRDPEDAVLAAEERLRKMTGGGPIAWNGDTCSVPAVRREYVQVVSATLH